jgi:hypothetical protein
MAKRYPLTELQTKVLFFIANNPDCKVSVIGKALYGCSAIHKTGMVLFKMVRRKYATAKLTKGEKGQKYNIYRITNKGRKELGISMGAENCMIGMIKDICCPDLADCESRMRDLEFDDGTCCMCYKATWNK